MDRTALRLMPPWRRMWEKTFVGPGQPPPPTPSWAAAYAALEAEVGKTFGVVKIELEENIWGSEDFDCIEQHLGIKI